MRTFIICAALLLLTLPLTAAAQDAQRTSYTVSPTSEQSLLQGLNSENSGVQRACILMLGKLRSERAAIPLMKILHESPNPNLRSASAYALCRIGHSAGTYAVLRSASFDEDGVVRARCAWYYRTFVQQQMEFADNGGR